MRAPRGLRTFLRAVVVAGLIAGISLPAAATSLVQTFQHESWDEKPDQTLAEAATAVREAHPYLVDLRTADMARTQTVQGYRGRGLEVGIPPGFFRGFGPYARLAQPADEAWFRYFVYLSDFRPVGSGKLPGLADASRTANAKGCKPSTESSPGWSARMMFDRLGTLGAGPDEVPIGYYIYHLNQQGSCGDEYVFAALEQERWTCVEGHVRMNTPGSADGVVEAWIDGKLVFSESGFEFRRPGEQLTVREMWDNVYFGGSYPTPNHLALILDEISVSTDGRVRCLDPFIDDNESVHVDDLTELHRRGLFYGCDSLNRLACPENKLTRAEFAAILQRVLNVPPGPDAFVDDDGHWGEQALNAMAAIDVIRGCDPPANRRACPDSEITRAEVAAIVVRALGLPPGPDAFPDDRGHWAEGDINALAAAGITRGCRDGVAFCPENNISRAEAATFTLRVHDRLEEVKPLAAPELPEWPPKGPPPPKPPEEQE